MGWYDNLLRFGGAFDWITPLVNEAGGYNYAVVWDATPELAGQVSIVLDRYEIPNRIEYQPTLDTATVVTTAEGYRKCQKLKVLQQFLR